jgi:hypothetical protein
MKIEITEDGAIVLKEVYSGVLLETEEGNQIGLRMRDDTFEGKIVRGTDGAAGNIRIDMQALSIVNIDTALLQGLK